MKKNSTKLNKKVGGGEMVTGFKKQTKKWGSGGGGE